MKEIETHSQRKIIKFSVTGLPEEIWRNLKNKLLSIIESLSKKIAESAIIDNTSINSTNDLGNDITNIATNWERVKLEKPSIENDKLLTEIAVKFALIKKTIAEAEKTDEETKSLKIKNRHKEIVYWMEELERIISLMRIMEGAKVHYKKIGNDGHLFIGGNPSEYNIEDDEIST